MSEMTEQQIQWAKDAIDKMTQGEMARLWRYAPAGHPYFDCTLPLADYFQARFKGFTPAISKQLGWEDNHV